MIRERVLKVVLVIFGLLFLASIYPIYANIWDKATEGETMMLSVYFALGVFLLMAVRRPAAHRSLIAFAGWANIAHGVVMLVMAIGRPADRTELLVAAAMVLPIGVILAALTPRRDSAEELKVAASATTS